ncbi:MAG: DegQ family serine endoprotease [Alphaproteobacteria bacterium]|nr:DegQ family serine endoprotease [Alphaproteobacteria bacterium]
MVVVVLAAVAWIPVRAEARGAPDSFADLADKLLPAVVNISTTQKVAGRTEEAPQFDFPPGSPFRDFFDQFQRKRREAPQRRGTSLGSGFIIDKTGYIVTNNHVIEGADQITVVLHDERKFEAELIGRDPKTDLALLKMKSGDNFPYVPFGDSDKMRVGDWVLAIGNPLGLGGSVTAGIVSARGRDIRSGPYDDYIQTDAPINRGNSGGPLFNIKGEVIGINTAILSPSGGSIGIGFSIPSQLAVGVVEQLRKYGSTRRGWLGVQIQAVTDEIAESLGLQNTKGALVAGVVKQSPAEAAGFKTGDVIMTFDGRRVPESRKLPRMVAETDVGKKVRVVVWRNGKKEVLSVQLGELEKVDQASLTAGGAESKGKGDGREFKELGLTLAPLSKDLAKRFEIEDQPEGVVVTEVDDDSNASEKGLRPGNVIVEINQEKVKSTEDVTKQVEKAQKAGRRSILLLVNQGGDLRFLALRLKEKKS